MVIVNEDLIVFVTYNTYKEISIENVFFDDLRLKCLHNEKISRSKSRALRSAVLTGYVYLFQYHARFVEHF